MPRRRRRDGLNLAVMGLMMGASLLLPMITGQGANPLEMFGLGNILGGGKKGGEEKKAQPEAAPATRSSSAPRRAPLVLDVPRITAKRPSSRGPAAPAPRTPAPAPPQGGVAQHPAPVSASRPGGSAALAAPPTIDLVALKVTRDSTYTELRAALRSGDPQRVQVASVAYGDAERALRDARSGTY